MYIYIYIIYVYLYIYVYIYNMVIAVSLPNLSVLGFQDFQVAPSLDKITSRSSVLRSRTAAARTIRC